MELAAVCVGEVGEARGRSWRVVAVESAAVGEGEGEGRVAWLGR